MGKSLYGAVIIAKSLLKSTMTSPSPLKGYDMSDTVTDFSPICPHCGEYIKIDDGRIAIALIIQYGELELYCHKCNKPVIIECTLVYTIRKTIKP